MSTHVTYCRICEPLCGLIATVEDGRLIQLRPDKDHPLSQGQACPKGIAFTEIQNDPDRVLHPLRKNADGEFERVTWEAALEEISSRLSTVKKQHGGDSIGLYFGNPAAFSYSHALWTMLFAKALRTKHVYSAGSQDINSRFAASDLLYGDVSQIPFPDIPRTDFLLMIGANPLISHGSALSMPRIKDHLSGVVKRGGRVVVVDPRRTETGAAYEHLAVRPDSDAFLLLSLLHVIFSEDLEDASAIAEQTTGIDAIRQVALQHSPEETAAITGVDADTVRALARDFATAGSATAYGRTGACLGRNATVVSFLIDVLSIVTGNLDRAGGTVFSHGVVPAEEIARQVGLIGYAQGTSRIGGFPDVLGTYPATIMAAEMTTPGRGQLRALFVSAGNPVLSTPDGAALEEALEGLDLMVSMDLYVNETNKHADFVLPATTWLEREDYPVGVASAAPTPFLQATEAVVPAYGEARQEWEVFDEVARRAGIGLFLLGPLTHLSGPVAFLWRHLPARPTPRLLIETMLRIGAYGDRFGLRKGGLNPKRLRENPHGIVLGEYAGTGRLREVVRHRGGKVRLDPPSVIGAIRALSSQEDADFPLLMVGLRELKSHNSWMHNSSALMRGKTRTHRARVNPADAAAAGISDGDAIRVSSRSGEIETIATLSDEVGPGTIAVPHGWGHSGGSWERANKSGGANVNVLASSDVADIERLGGMAHLSGIPVAISPVDA